VPNFVLHQAGLSAMDLAQTEQLKQALEKACKALLFCWF
jgi:hypothetical protein